MFAEEHDAKMTIELMNVITVFFLDLIFFNIMLYLICTPIGNLNDLSLRSINTLKEVDYIYAEDTRVSAKLFQHFKISRKSLPFHEHNEIKQTVEIIKAIIRGAGYSHYV